MPEVRLLSGTSVLEDADCAAVQDLRALAAAKLGAPVARVRLLLGTEVLEDSQLISDLGDTPVVTALVLAQSLALSGHADCRWRLWDLASQPECVSDEMWSLTEYTPGLISATEGHGDAIRALDVDWGVWRAITGSADWTLRVWNFSGLNANCEGVLHGHSAPVCAVRANFRTRPRNTIESVVPANVPPDADVPPDDASDSGNTPRLGYAVSGSEDSTVILWDLEGMTCIFQLNEQHMRPVYAVGLASNGPQGHAAVSAGRDAALYVWDLSGGKLRGRLEGHGSWVLALCVEADGGHAITASKDRSLRLWDLKAMCCSAAFLGHEAAVTCLDADFTQRRALSASEDGTLRIWNLENITCLVVMPNSTQGILRSLSANFESQIAVMGCHMGTLAVWDLASSCLLHTIESVGGSVLAVQAEQGRHLRC